MVERYEKDGKVAVLYSPGYGAGWSSWAEDKYRETMMFDKRLVELLLNNKDRLKDQNLVDSIITGNTKDSIYIGGVENLQIEWIPKGYGVRIDEHDGYESITTNYIYAIL